MKKQNIKQISLCAIFTAIIAVSAWLCVPTPFGINFTFQIFGVCLAGFVLGAKNAVLTTAVYIILGASGLPVFSSFTGGIGVLTGVSGGFLWGFIFTAFLCGISVRTENRFLKVLVGIFSVLICHITGIIQFSFVSGVNFITAFLTASLPFLAKDFIVLFLAAAVAKKIKPRI